VYELRRILVPSDFSSHADDALAYAVALGRPFDAHVTMLVVDEFCVSPLGARKPPPPFVVPSQQNALRVLDEEARRRVEPFRSAGVNIDVQIAEGRAYKVIVEEAERLAYDIVVIATRGQTNLSPHLLGSTAERVVRFSRQPVLSIQNPPAPGVKVSSVLCPTDFSPAGNGGLSYALSIARLNKAKLYVQYVSEIDKAERESEIRKRIPDLKLHHPKAESVTVEYIFDRDIEPSNSIIRFADDRDVSVIVMSTHGRKGLRRVFIGNTTAEVVRASRRPVLTVTHPFHKEMFSLPVTANRESDFPIGTG
jgi:nucleotide-binding universal stress UspA family protein